MYGAVLPVKIQNEVDLGIDCKFHGGLSGQVIPIERIKHRRPFTDVFDGLSYDDFGQA